MRRIRNRVAGLDVHRDTVVACCQIAHPNQSVEVTKQSFSTTSKGLSELATWLRDTGVETVAMEATGVYWKPVYYSLEGLFDDLWLCNAQHVKNVPGRKTDLADAEWLADVAAHGMVRTELRAATRDSRAARAHPLPQDPGPSASQGDSASREVSPRRRHQVDLGGVGGVEHVVARND